MKEIVILSGKGGVGKSSLAAAIGTILAEESRVVLQTLMLMHPTSI